MRKITVFLLLCFFLATGVKGGGYQVGLHGQKQIGMGLIGTSLAFDASSLFYNPGGLSFMNPKYSVAFGASGIRSYTVFQKSSPSVSESMTNNPWGTPFYFYGAAKITEKLSAGIAVNTPYGNSLTWSKEWTGRYLIQDLSLKAIFIQPTLSYKINDFIGIGVGLVYATGDFEINKALPVRDQNGEGDVNITGKANNLGFNAGVLIRPVQNLSIGIDYRSAVDMETEDAEADFTVPVSLSGNFPDTKVTTKLPLPANLDFGASYIFNNKLTVGINFNYVFWSAYDSLIFDFADNTPSLADSRNPREYTSKLIIRGGAEYKISDAFHVRAGAYYDPSPVNTEFFSPETPSLNSIGLTTGFSYYPIEKLAIDVSFLYISGQEGQRNYAPDNFSGNYKTRSFIPGFGLTYNF